MPIIIFIGNFIKGKVTQLINKHQGSKAKGEQYFQHGNRLCIDHGRGDMTL